MVEHNQPTDWIGQFFPKDGKGLLTQAEEALVRQRVCPKCSDHLSLTSDVGGLSGSQCIGCKCVFIVSASGQPYVPLYRATSKEQP